MISASLLQNQFKIVDNFNTTYWSGEDVAIYADNVFLQEAFQLNYMITEQVRPYYGYASYIPDRVIHGSRIITGEISLNFKQDSYVYSLIQLLSKTDNSFLKSSINKTDLSQTGTRIRPVLPMTNISNSLSAPTIEQFNNNPQLAAEYAKRKKQLTTALDTEDVNKYQSDINEVSGIFETRPSGFDISIILGAGIKTAQILRMDTDSTSYYTDGIIDQTKNVGQMSPATGKKLIGVDLMQQAVSMNDDGRGFVETWTFQARDLQILNHIDLDGTQEAAIKTAFGNAESLQ